MLVKFLHLKIENFKSIENLEFDFGKTTKIYGANETGKTTVADAIAWVLTGKNSLGESTFNIVPVGSSGVSPSVELKIHIGGKDSGLNKKPTLKRVYKAKIGRDKKFTGAYQTDCYVNGVKCTQRDFERWIDDNICDPEIFRLVHDVKYFTENISTKGKERPWEARRRLLSGLSGLQSDYQIAVSEERFRDISEQLTSFDDANQLLNWIKNEISESENQLVYINSQIMAYESMLTGENPTIYNEKELISNQKEMEKRRDKLQEEYNDEIEERNRRIREITISEAQAEKETSRIEGELGNAFRSVDEAKRNFEKYGTACPTCGRKFARAWSEKKKSEYDAYCEGKVKEIEWINMKLELAKRTKADIEKERESILNEPVMERPSEIDEIEDDLLEIQKKIAILKSNNKQKEVIERKIKDARSQQKDFSKKLSELQRYYDLCKEFISYKCQIVEEAVNSMFDGVTFEMFKKNSSNDEIRQCCEIKYNGVDYTDLSYSSKFYASLMIVLGFQKAYDLIMPIVVDNAESIDLGREFETQMIFLTKRDELCPACGKDMGRKHADGMWHCDCGWFGNKKLEVTI